VLELVVHEARSVHRLDRGADRLAATIEASRQSAQTIDIGRRGTDLDSRALVSQWKSRRLRLRSNPAYNIEAGLLCDSSQ
jgi:hypothetical protein